MQDYVPEAAPSQTGTESSADVTRPLSSFIGWMAKGGNCLESASFDPSAEVVNGPFCIRVPSESCAISAIFLTMAVALLWQHWTSVETHTRSNQFVFRMIHVIRGTSSYCSTSRMLTDLSSVMENPKYIQYLQLSLNILGKTVHQFVAFLEIGLYFYVKSQ